MKIFVAGGTGAIGRPLIAELLAKGHVLEDHMAKSCEHLEGLTSEGFPAQRTPGACEECLTQGTVWVALRECRSCGHVGCCDSSTGKHATQHFHGTQHPVMRAIPPAAWTWCYVHETQGMLG